MQFMHCAYFADVRSENFGKFRTLLMLEDYLITVHGSSASLCLFKGMAFVLIRTFNSFKVRNPVVNVLISHTQ